jgi:hypothetical protein
MRILMLKYVILAANKGSNQRHLRVILHMYFDAEMCDFGSKPRL